MSAIDSALDGATYWYDESDNKVEIVNVISRRNKPVRVEYEYDDGAEYSEDVSVFRDDFTKNPSE